MTSSPTSGAIAAGVREIRALLDSTGHWRRFTPRLEADFGAFLRERVLEFLSRGWLVLLLFYVAVGLSTYVQVSLMSAPAFRPGNLEVWWTIFLAEGLPIAGLLLLPRVRFLRRHFHVALGVIAMFAICAIAVGTSAFPDPFFNIHSSYVVIFIQAICYGIGAFRLRHAVLVVASAGLLSLLVIKASGLWLEWGFFQQYVLMANVVGMMLCFMIEQRDRRVFLQGELLKLEKEGLDLVSSELERLSREDGLTGLANRRYFDQVLLQEWERARREAHPVALVFVDVDHFKPFNDTYGHQEGDAVLARVGATLRACLRRPGDLAARYGGEEFVLLLPGTHEEGAIEVARQVRRAISGLGIPHAASSTSDHITASLGVAAVIPGDLDSDTLVAAADVAVYAAKGAGRNCIMLGGTDRPMLVHPGDAQAA